MRTFKLTLCYDGTRYRGWQKQGNTSNTIQAKLETLLSRLLDQPIEVQGSGRTDAGVHAAGQVASFRADTELSCPEILYGLREYLPEDIGALSVTEMGGRFHARLSAADKTYIYRVWNSETPCVFERKYVYVYPRPLDIDAMQAAADRLCGRHDFAAFSTGKKRGNAATRTLHSVEVERVGEEVRLRFCADGFLYNMARILTGTLLEIGAGERSADCVDEIFAAGERAKAGFTAPARGLCLESVRYTAGIMEMR